MGEKLTEEQREELFKPLRNQIISGKTDYNKFHVFDYEASSGKTYQYCMALVQLHNTKGIYWGNPDPMIKNPKALIVIKTINEGKEVEAQLNNFYAKYAKKKQYRQFALAISSKHGKDINSRFDRYSQEDVEDIRKYPVLIITQAEYLRICRDKDSGQQLYGDRRILIVDEEVDFVYHTFDSITVSQIAIIEDQYLNQAYSCKPIFKNIVHDIRGALAKRHEQMKRILLKFDDKILQSLQDRFVTALNNAVNEKFVKNLSKKTGLVKEDADVNKVKADILDRVNRLSKFYNNDDVIIYSNGLYRYDPNIKPFALKNNIWIDASARFNHLYELDFNLFEICNTPRLIDHCDSTLYIDTVNCSTSSGKQRKYDDLEKDVLRDLQENLRDDDKILIIDNKDECAYINELIQKDDEFIRLREINGDVNYDENYEDKNYEEDDTPKTVDTVNFFAMRGRNKWKEHNKCYVLQQPQLIFPYYIFLYEYWTKQKLTDIEMHTMVHVDEESGFNTYGFAPPNKMGKEIVEVTDEQKKRVEDLERLRQTSQLSSIYQGLKRIQRNDSPKGEFYVILNDLKMVSMLTHQFHNIDVEKYIFKLSGRKGISSKTPAKDAILWVLEELEEESIISIDEIMTKCNLTRGNVTKTLQRYGRFISKKLADKNIKLLKEISEAARILLLLKPDTPIELKEFEKIFNIKWENFKRNKDAKMIIKHKEIFIQYGKIKAKK